MHSDLGRGSFYSHKTEKNSKRGQKLRTPESTSRVQLVSDTNC